MVVTGRSSWRRVAVSIAAIFFLALNLHLARLQGAYQTETSTSPGTSKTQRRKIRTRPRRKPTKPVPLGTLGPVPIETRNSGRNPLETFFQALSNLESASPAASTPPVVVRIIHFGDSHVASDYWSGVVRGKLQERFGNAGPGFVLPGHPWPTIRYADAQSLDGLGWRTDGLEAGENDGIVGLGGMSIESYREANPASAQASFSRFDILVATSLGNSCLQVQVDDSDFLDLSPHLEPVIPRRPSPDSLLPEPASKSLGGGAADPPDPLFQPTTIRRRKKHRKAMPYAPPFRPWPADWPLDLLDLANPEPLAAGPHRISIRSSCGSAARLLGMELYSGSKGILYDTEGINGARLADLEKPLPPLRLALLQQSHSALILVSYGTNDIVTKGFNSSEYEERAFQILSKLRADAGDASILVTGPTDRGSPRKKTRLLIQAGQAALQPALRKAALRAGCAYWDQQNAMGGRGSMTRWVRAGLAGHDYIHFSSLGYQKLADMLYDQLMAEYGEFLKTKTSQ